MIPALVGASLYQVARRGLGFLPAAQRKQLQRTNYAKRTVSLTGGLATTLAATTAASLARSDRRTALAAALATGIAGATGAIDDLCESGETVRGFQGHLGALREGRITTGALKILGIGAGAGLASALLPHRRPGLRGLPGWAADATLIAAFANLVNLFDLRPGRALKATTLTGIAAILPPRGTATGADVGKELAAVLIAVSASAMPDDLAERTMLGDTGANALGALAGVGLAARYSAGTRLSVTGIVVALVLLSEVVSFSAIIRNTHWLTVLDDLGRRR